MTKLRCMIIDDEPLSVDVVAGFIKEIPWLELVGTCFNAIEAMEQLSTQPADLLFLDINMPKLSGVDFARAMEKPPMIIFTTAYPEYAVEGFELDAVDYLVKPIAFDRFVRSVNKAREKYDMRRSIEKNLEPGHYMILKSDRKIFKISEADIQYIQSIGDYVKVFTKEKVIITTDTLKNIENNMSDHFVRIHKSFIVSLNAIKYVEGNLVNIEGTALPIGYTYREAFFSRFNNLR